MRVVIGLFIFFSWGYAQASGQWLVGAYQKGFQILVTPPVKKIVLGQPVPWGAGVKTQEGAAQLTQGDTWIWMAPHTEVKTFNQESSLESGIQLELVKGSIRIKGPTKLIFLLGECVLDGSQDLVWSWDPQGLSLSVDVLKGEISLPCFDFDKQVKVTEGQTLTFTADKQQGEPVFDMLPSGRKMPRGLLGEPQKMPINQAKNWLKWEVELKRQSSPPPPPKKKVIKLLCSNPSGNLGQCAYVCEGAKKGEKSCNYQREGVKCVRYSCSAEGKWVYALEMPRDFDCPTPSRVGTCQ